MTLLLLGVSGSQGDGQSNLSHLSFDEACLEGRKVHHEFVYWRGGVEEPRSSDQLDLTIAALRRHAERN
ncbi:MAG: hypothetical protein WAL35_02375 [Acidimicrobiales bacterium]